MSLTVEIDENIFGEDLFSHEVLGEISAVFGDDVDAAKAAAEAAMAEAQAKAAAEAAMTGAKAETGKKRRKKHCPVVTCPICSADLCVIYASPRMQTSDEMLSSRDVSPPATRGAPPPAPVVRAAMKAVPKARVVGAVATFASEFFKQAPGAPAAPSAPVRSIKAPRALMHTGSGFSGACPSCGTSLDLTVAVTGSTKSAAPMTVKQIVGDDGVFGEEDDIVGDILNELVGDTPKTPPKPTPPKPTPPVDEQPAWQKYLNLAAGFLPAVTEGIAAAARPASATPPVDPNINKEPPPKPVSFLAQDAGPLPVWGWGAALLVVGGGLLYWKKSKKPS